MRKAEEIAEERKRILAMLRDDTIDVEEAVGQLATLDASWSDFAQRNNDGVAAEKSGDLTTAIVLYELNARDGFEGNHPYDRLAIIYRKLKRPTDEKRILQKAIQVFQELERTSPRTDVAPKLARFEERLRKLCGKDPA